MHELYTKRVYLPFASTDGYRILVDRIWPRGIKKVDAHLDSWKKKIAPSNELRKWFHHDPQRFEIFKTKYREELEQNGEAQRLVEIVRKQLETQNVTLLYGAKDTQDNQAVVLKEWLLEKLVPSKTL